MSQQFHDLCCLLVEELHGAFHASLYSHLTPSGRCTAGQIAHSVRLPIRQVKAGLATLIQARLVYHHTSNGITIYQASTRSAYDLVRCGKLVELAQSRHGKIGGEIIAGAFLLGFSTIAELGQRVVRSIEKTDQHQTNGSSLSTSEHASDFSEVCVVIQNLVRDQFLTCIRSAQFQADHDALGDAEIVLKDRGFFPPTKGRKGLIEYEIKVQQEKRNRQSINTTETGYIPDARSYQTDGPADQPTKRRKITDSISEPKTNGYHAGNSRDLSESTLVSISYHTVVSSIRNQRLAMLFKRKLGSQDHRLLEATLAQVPITDQRTLVEDRIDLDLSALKKYLDGDKASNSKKNQPTMNGHDESEWSDRNGVHSINDIDEDLAVVAESAFNFVVEGYQHKQWQIDKRALDAFLQRSEMLRLIKDRLQPPALRIVRMLIQKGKMDEKTLQEAGLLGAKQLRQTLAELKQMGFVDLQEVPREVQRQPNRTIFLWFFDSRSVQQLLQENMYKTMTRLMQRLKLERNKVASTLEKVERSDVHGSEEQVLSTAELKVLRRFQRTEQWLIGELGRLDTSVAILRDL